MRDVNPPNVSWELLIGLWQEIWMFDAARLVAQRWRHLTDGAVPWVISIKNIQETDRHYYIHALAEFCE